MNDVAEYYELTTSIPQPYELSHRPEQSLRATDNPPDVLGIGESIIPLWDLKIGAELIKPAVPVGIRLRREPDYFFAENDSLSIYGSGKTPEAAIADFKETAGTFAEEYRALGPDAVIGL